MTLIAVASENDQGLQGLVSAHFGRCPYYTLIEAEGARTVSHRIARNPNVSQHRPGAMPKFIHSLGADVILAGGMGPMAVEMFHRFGIEVITGAAGTVNDAVQAYLSGTLTGIVPCNHDHPDSCGKHDPGQPCQEDATGPGERWNATSIGAARVAIPAVDDSGLGAEMDPRFGRAPFFVLLDLQSGALEAIVQNTASDAAHGAGTHAARVMSERGVQTVVAGRFGPKAVDALSALGIMQCTAPEGLTVGQVLEELRAGHLPRSR